MSHKKNNILVFDTTTIACTVALKTSQGIFSRHEKSANIHSQALLSMIDEILHEAKTALSDVDYLAVGVGPGSFTGLRIGIGVAQALAYTNSLPILAISSLEMLAVSAVTSDHELDDGDMLLVAHDARMSEIYTVTYELSRKNRLIAKTDTILAKPEEMTLFQSIDSPLNICGNAWKEYSDKLTHLDLLGVKKINIIVPDAKSVSDYIDDYLIEFEPIFWQELRPIYVRNDVAKKSSKTAF